jgi:hypothetical protein
VAIHPGFLSSPYVVLCTNIRWIQADEVLHSSSFKKLLPPLVHKSCLRLDQGTESLLRQAM